METRDRIMTVSSSNRHAWAQVRAVLVAIFLLQFACADTRAQDTVKLDPAGAKVEFTLSDVLHTVHGSFKVKSSTLHFDPASHKISGQIVVDATSGDSGNSSRDRRMHKEILESEQFPEITFIPTQVQGDISTSAPAHIEVAGHFSIHGQDHQVTLPVDVQPEGKQLKLSSVMVIPYVQWGMKNPSNFILHVSDKVKIDIHAVALLP
jgi:polyisoprenoid-binding protein YceI